MFAVVAGHDEVQVETHLVEHRPVLNDSLHGLAMRQRERLAHLVADHRVAHQLLGEREVPLVPNDQVVQLHYFTGGAGHSNTASASTSSMAATARSVSFRHSRRDRSGNDSQVIKAVTGRQIR